MGCTTHFIDYEMDEGITICQGIIRKTNDTYENHQKKLFFVLCLTFISTIILVVEKRLIILNNKCKYIDVTYENIFINPCPKEIDIIKNNLMVLHNF
jgi:folate-dependent phosphoribosylglycinamide formyltransferase PurN